MLVLSNTNYQIYRSIVKNKKIKIHKCLKCNTELPDYNKVTMSRQSENIIINKYRLCDSCNISNRAHSPVNGRYGI